MRLDPMLKEFLVDTAIAIALGSATIFFLDLVKDVAFALWLTDMSQQPIGW